MDYKAKKIEGNKEEFFIYRPKPLKNKMKKNDKKVTKDNPFGKLSELRFR